MNPEFIVNTLVWAGLLSLCISPRISGAYQAALFGGCVLALNINILGWPVTTYLSSLTGGWSIGALILTSIALLKQWNISYGVRPAEASFIQVVCIIPYLVLGLSALGITQFDLYSIGYSPIALLATLVAVFICAWLLRHFIFCCWLLAAVTAFQFRIFDSDNLWDYLIDPLLAIWMLIKLAANLMYQLPNFLARLQGKERDDPELDN